MFQRIARVEQERFRKRAEIPADAVDAVSVNVEALGSALPTGTRSAKATGPQSLLQVSAGKSHQTVLIGAAGILAGILAFRRFVAKIFTFLNKRFDPWALSSSATATLNSQVRAEEEAFSEFLAAFRVGQTAAPRSSSVAGDAPLREAPWNAAGSDRRSEYNGVEDFPARAPELLATLRKLLEKIRWAADDSVRQKLVGELHRQTGSLREQAGHPEFQPAWQMGGALEGLIKQITLQKSNVTPSTLRTIGVSLDLLDELCVKGLRADLVTNPPFRLLAVDDDPISRHALSWALNKSLSQPDLAENGEAALALVARQPYDVIFLDVQMPGMDGFELCSKIHDIASNRNTPVVFVTCQSDFNARAESTLCGGNDLIGKPFLTFEITVMALTLGLRRRLQTGGRVLHPSENAIRPELLSTCRPETRAVAVAGASAAMPAALPVDHHDDTKGPLAGYGRRGEEEALAPGWTGGDRQRALTPSASIPGCPFPASGTPERSDSCIPSGPPTNEHGDAFLTHAPSQVKAVRDLLQAIHGAEDQDERQEMLVDLYLFIHSLTISADLAGVRPAFRMSATLEGLIKKLLESPGNSTASTLQTVTAAVDLLNDLCMKGLKADAASNPPIRLLVVDDDPIARRAVGGALQMEFEKPDFAENGEAALTLAGQQPYDVIFLDVVMPGMDGFALCPRIHRTAANRDTPVVFVTNQNDPKWLAQSTLCGGSGFITKPFLKAEITTKALLFALRRRLTPVSGSSG